MGIGVRMEVASTRSEPDYLHMRLTEEQIAGGAHRDWVGGRWEQLGRLQRDFVLGRGLRPEHRLLDVGCGSLRAGVQLLDHLAPGHYYGIDIGLAILEAGYYHELTDAQRRLLPAENLRATDRFDADFGVRFDIAIAQSLFTHITLNQIRLCLYRVGLVMKPGGRFFATFFEQSADTPVDEVRGNKLTERNPYWYYRRDLRWAAGKQWSFHYIGRWGHPGGQRMVEFRRIGPDSVR
jgi:SAM-dependent methyltransferase